MRKIKPIDLLRDEVESFQKIAGAYKVNLQRSQAENRKLRKAIALAVNDWSTCSHEGGCLPGGFNPVPKKDWCSHCRLKYILKGSGSE